MEKPETVRSRQSKATKEGKKFESYIKSTLNGDPHLIDQKIHVYNNKDLCDDKELLSRLSIKIRNYTSPRNSLHLIAKNTESGTPIALICCKLSLHGRIPETLFYSWFYKTYLKDKGIKVVLVTPDKGRQDKSQTWKSEWGTYTKPTKSRILSECFLDGVYIDNNYLKERLNLDGNTHIEGNLHPVSDLAKHLMDWKKG